MSNRDRNIAAIKIVAEGLMPLMEPVIFVGGATVGLYIDAPAVPEIRMTQDVDCVVEVDFLRMTLLTEKLIAAGFTPTPPVICRYAYRGIVVDIMPADSKVFGFSNRWYSDAISRRQPYRLSQERLVYVFSFPDFVATKLEAFNGRGSLDWLVSSDLEDIIAVLDGRTTAETELIATSGPLGEYIRAQFGTMLSNAGFDDILSGHLGAYPGQLNEQRAQRVRVLMERVARAPLSATPSSAMK